MNGILQLVIRSFSHVTVLKSLNFRESFIWSCLLHMHAKQVHLNLHFHCSPQTLRFVAVRHAQKRRVLGSRMALFYILQIECITGNCDVQAYSRNTAQRTPVTQNTSLHTVPSRSIVINSNNVFFSVLYTEFHNHNTVKSSRSSNYI